MPFLGRLNRWVSEIIGNVGSNPIYGTIFKQLNNSKMRKVLLTIALFSGLNGHLYAQKVVINGNEITLATTAKRSVEPEKTVYTFTDSKGKKYPVFKGAKGGLFVVRISKKTGKEYRQYLPTK
jgi:hypothetical protein